MRWLAQALLEFAMKTAGVDAMTKTQLFVNSRIIISGRGRTDAKSRSYMMRKKDNILAHDTPAKSLNKNSSQRKLETTTRKREKRIEPFKSIPQAQALDFILQAMVDFEPQFEEDSDDEENKDMFGTMMKCPENE